MVATVNAHSLLSGRDPAAFLTKISPSEDDRETLLEARKMIRGHLRKRFNDLSQNFLEQQRRSLIDKYSTQPIRLRPKFASQGSFVYGTLNSPAHCPPQEMDLDDGMYLPLEIIDKVPPKVASQMLFRVVGDFLQELCDVNPGWKMERKSTCCRVKLPTAGHLDVPLYAYPEAYEQNLVEAAEAIVVAKALNFQDALLEVRLDSDKVWLAHRDNGWQQSDPKKIHDWFKDRVDLHGPQLRRICRFLKAWRDHHFEKGGVPSIALMAHAVHVFDRVPMAPDRDDLALLRVAERLPSLLSMRVENPTIDVPEGDPSKYLDGCLSQSDRDAAVRAADALRADLSEALENQYQRQRTLNCLRKALGNRLSVDRADLVKVEAAKEAVVTSVAPSILAPAEIPHRSKSA